MFFALGRWGSSVCQIELSLMGEGIRAHLGIGLPTIYQSGMIAADLISEKYDQKKD
jgi:hypothetical protein